MGLDQYLYKIIDAEKSDSINKKFTDLNKEKDKLSEKIFNEFKKDFQIEIKEFIEYLIELEDKYKNNEKINYFTFFDKNNENENFNDTAINFLLILRDMIYENLKKPNDEIQNEIKIALFNYFPIVNVSGDEKEKLKNKIIDEFIKVLEKIFDKAEKKYKNDLVKLKELIIETEKLANEIEDYEILVIEWRKANQIHKWFVDHVKFVKNDIESEIFDGSVLLKLKKDIEKVLDLIKNNYNENELENLKIQPGNPLYDKIMKIMPPTSGFFFGSTDIDWWYVRQLENTLEELNDLDPKPGEKYYYYAWY